MLSLHDSYTHIVTVTKDVTRTASECLLDNEVEHPSKDDIVPEFEYEVSPTCPAKIPRITTDVVPASGKPDLYASHVCEPSCTINTERSFTPLWGKFESILQRHVVTVWRSFCNPSGTAKIDGKLSFSISNATESRVIATIGMPVECSCDNGIDDCDLHSELDMFLTEYSERVCKDLGRQFTVEFIGEVKTNVIVDGKRRLAKCAVLSATCEASYHSTTPLSRVSLDYDSET